VTATDDDRHRSGGPTAPPAVGVRLPWPSVPVGLRHAVEQHLGAPVADAVTQPGGFSPGVAVRLRLTDGTRAFVKAVGARPHPDSADIHRAEARIAAALPAGTPAPRLLGYLDQDGWVVLIFEDIDGVMPSQPWIWSELERVLHAVGDLATALTPTPIDAPTVAARFGDALTGWQHLRDARDGGHDDLAGLDPWARRHLSGLAALEASWQDAAEGDSLVHTDLRADNLLLTDDRVVVVDWPWACTAAPWFDLLAMLPSVHMQGGPPPETLFDNHPVARQADPTPSPPSWSPWPDTSYGRAASPLPQACPHCANSKPPKPARHWHGCAPEPAGDSAEDRPAITIRMCYYARSGSSPHCGYHRFTQCTPDSSSR
jgi:aminoglycoside phosphotransferase (APT) family kinase protein